MGKTVLIVEDEQSIVDILSFNLTKEGYDTLEALDGPTGLQLALEQNPDLVLLDLMLPGLSGEEVLAKIGNVPVIVVSAKVGVENRVNLLLRGAVDYLEKPFDSRELLARVAVHLRESAAPGPASVLEAGPLRLDPAAHAVTAAGIPVRLTKTEYAILKLFLQNPGQVIAKSVILDRISADTPDCTESSLKIHISNLRKKLRDVTGQDHIESVWGIGFKLNTFEEDQHV